MTPFQQHLKEALYLNENVPEIKPIQSDPDSNPIYPSGFDVFNPGGRETVAPPGGGDLLPGWLMPGGKAPRPGIDPPPWYYVNEDGTVMIDPDGTGEWEDFYDYENPAQDSEDETEDEGGGGRDILPDPSLNEPTIPSVKDQLRDAIEEWENQNPDLMTEEEHLAEWLDCCAGNGETFQDYLDRIEQEYLDAYPSIYDNFWPIELPTYNAPLEFSPYPRR